jgi:hypothetical protein
VSPLGHELAKLPPFKDVTPVEVLRALIAAGLTFGDAVPVFAEGRSARKLAYVAAAQERTIHEEGTLEVDDEAIVSEGDGEGDAGAYVMAWLWVPDDCVPDLPPATEENSR